MRVWNKKKKRQIKKRGREIKEKPNQNYEKKRPKERTKEDEFLLPIFFSFRRKKGKKKKLIPLNALSRHCHSPLLFISLSLSLSVCVCAERRRGREWKTLSHSFPSLLFYSFFPSSAPAAGAAAAPSPLPPAAPPPPPPPSPPSAMSLVHSVRLSLSSCMIKVESL